MSVRHICLESEDEVDGVEAGWSRVFNSFGFIALLVCAAVLLTAISFSNADESRDPTGDLLLLQSQGALMIDIEAATPGNIPGTGQRN